MASVLFNETSLQALKGYLADDFFEVKSSHITEALASALGFKTHAALLEALKQVGNRVDYRLLHTRRFLNRLIDFGYSDDPEFDFELALFSEEKPEGVISTQPLSSYDVSYKSVRAQAWRNLMVSAVNEGLRRQLFSLKPSDNRWTEGRLPGTFFDFELPGGEPAKGYVSDAGFDELNVHVAVHPTRENIAAADVGFFAGDAVAQGWLERRNGAWLQSSEERFCCRRPLLKLLAELTVEPMGYGDKGAVIL